MPRSASTLADVHGSRPLEYFIGSGTVGRSYLYSVDGFLYQAPVSWYSTPAKWDLSPGYQQYDRLFLTRGIEPVCLQCHSSGVQPVAGTTNGFRVPPFREGGVSCERCHGDGDAHVAGRGQDDQPGQTCAGPPRQHLRSMPSLRGSAHRPRGGGRRFVRAIVLSDSLAVFVWSGNTDMNVTSHFERLAESACKKASGDRLWCGSCHDPHRAPAEAEKAGILSGEVPPVPSGRRLQSRPGLCRLPHAEEAGTRCGALGVHRPRDSQAGRVALP